MRPVLLVVLLLKLLTGSRATIYVSSTNGTDTQSCGLSILPCASLQYAITNRSKGNSVILALPGVYFAGVRGIEMQNSSVTISGENAVVDCAGHGTAISIYAGQPIIQGLTVRNCTINGIHISGRGQHNASLQGVTVEHCGTSDSRGGGMVIQAGATPMIVNTTIRYNTAHSGGGIRISGIPILELSPTDVPPPALWSHPSLIVLLAWSQLGPLMPLCAA